MPQSTKIVLFIISVLFCAQILLAEEIGIGWEFNRDGDSEGWQAYHSLTDLSVSDGMLKATVTGDFPQFAGPEFELNASDYGFIKVRMKAFGAKDAIFQWRSDSVLWGVVKFDVQGDSAFHEYTIPVLNVKTWIGRILGMTRLTITASIGSQIEIDYIRIVHLGASPRISSFKPLRTVLKLDDQIPLQAIVRNSGGEPGRMKVDLLLPEAFALLQGQRTTELGVMEVGAVDTLLWLVTGHTTGNYTIALQLTLADSDTVQSSFEASVTDRYWRQQEFFLSAWSPPCAWSPPPLQDSVFEYYHKANFDLVLWVPPNRNGVDMTRRHGMRCQLILSWFAGGDSYLRTPDEHGYPKVSAEMLAKVGNIIDQFKNEPTVTGYFIIDEPHASAYPNLGKVVSYIRSKDPERLSFINLNPGSPSDNVHGGITYDEYIEQYLDIVKPELLSYDRYIFFKDHDGGDFFSNMAIIRKWALRYDIPFCNIIQAIGTDYSGLNWRTPTEAEHRWQVYCSLAYGAKAIIWFHWDADWGVTGSPDRDQLFASIKNVNTEIKAIGPEMIRLQSQAVYHTRITGVGEVLLPQNAPVASVSDNANLVIGFFKDANDRDYVMFTNKDYRDSVTATITLSSQFDSLAFFDIHTQQWQPVDFENRSDGAVFAVALRPGAGKLFALGHPINSYVAGRSGLPTKFRLWQNYPNPFNSETIVRYQLPSAGRTSLKIYNASGQTIRTLVDGERKAGIYHIVWNGADDQGNAVASGVYFLRLQNDRYSRIVKMIYLR